MSNKIISEEVIDFTSVFNLIHRNIHLWGLATDDYKFWLIKPGTPLAEVEKLYAEYHKDKISFEDRVRQNENNRKE